MGKILMITISMMALLLFSGCSGPERFVENIDDICIINGYVGVTDSKYQNPDYEQKYVPNGEIAYIDVECDNKFIIKDVEILGTCEMDKWGEECSSFSKKEWLLYPDKLVHRYEDHHCNNHMLIINDGTFEVHNLNRMCSDKFSDNYELVEKVK